MANNIRVDIPGGVTNIGFQCLYEIHDWAALQATTFWTALGSTSQYFVGAYRSDDSLEWGMNYTSVNTGAANHEINTDLRDNHGNAICLAGEGQLSIWDDPSFFYTTAPQYTPTMYRDLSGAAGAVRYHSKNAMLLTTSPATFGNYTLTGDGTYPNTISYLLFGQQGAGVAIPYSIMWIGVKNMDTDSWIYFSSFGPGEPDHGATGVVSNPFSSTSSIGLPLGQFETMKVDIPPKLDDVSSWPVGQDGYLWWYGSDSLQDGAGPSYIQMTPHGVEFNLLNDGSDDYTDLWLQNAQGNDTPPAPWFQWRDGISFTIGITTHGMVGQHNNATPVVNLTLGNNGDDLMQFGATIGVPVDGIDDSLKLQIFTPDFDQFYDREDFPLAGSPTPGRYDRTIYDWSNDSKVKLRFSYNAGIWKSEISTDDGAHYSTVHQTAQPLKMVERASFTLTAQGLNPDNSNWQVVFDGPYLPYFNDNATVVATAVISGNESHEGTGFSGMWNFNTGSTLPTFLGVAGVVGSPTEEGDGAMGLTFSMDGPSVYEQHGFSADVTSGNATITKTETTFFFNPVAVGRGGADIWGMGDSTYETWNGNGVVQTIYASSNDSLATINYGLWNGDTFNVVPGQSSEKAGWDKFHIICYYQDNGDTTGLLTTIWEINDTQVFSVYGVNITGMNSEGITQVLYGVDEYYLTSDDYVLDNITLTVVPLSSMPPAIYDDADTVTGVAVLDFAEKNPGVKVEATSSINSGLNIAGLIDVPVSLSASDALYVESTFIMPDNGITGYNTIDFYPFKVVVTYDPTDPVTSIFNHHIMPLIQSGLAATPGTEVAEYTTNIFPAGLRTPGDLHVNKPHTLKWFYRASEGSYIDIDGQRAYTVPQAPSASVPADEYGSAQDSYGNNPEIAQLNSVGLGGWVTTAHWSQNIDLYVSTSVLDAYTYDPAWNPPTPYDAASIFASCGMEVRLHFDGTSWYWQLYDRNAAVASSAGTNVVNPDTMYTVLLDFVHASGSLWNITLKINGSTELTWNNRNLIIGPGSAPSSFFGTFGGSGSSVGTPIQAAYFYQNFSLDDVTGAANVYSQAGLTFLGSQWTIPSASPGGLLAPHDAISDVLLGITDQIDNGTTTIVFQTIKIGTSEGASDILDYDYTDSSVHDATDLAYWFPNTNLGTLTYESDYIPA